MSIQNEGNPAPKSVEEQALAELEKEGHVIEGKEQPAPDNDPKEPAKEEPKKDEPKEIPKEEPKADPKPDRTPTMVEAWKLKVAEDQKSGLEKQVNELQSKLEELSKQKSPITSSQKEDVAEDVEVIIKKAEAAGQDGTFLRELATTILNKAKPSADIEKKLASIEQERALEKQLSAYSNEFETDVIPLVKDMNLSDSALSELKLKLRDYAFSETYAKVPLKEIFRIKEGEFEIKAPKKSSEGKAPKTRQNQTVDVDQIDEEAFKNLPPEQVEQFVQAKSAGTGWNKPGSHISRK